MQIQYPADVWARGALILDTEMTQQGDRWKVSSSVSTDKRGGYKSEEKNTFLQVVKTFSVVTTY